MQDLNKMSTNDFLQRIKRKLQTQDGCAYDPVVNPPTEAFYETYNPIFNPPHIEQTYNSGPSEAHADDLRQFDPSCIRDSIRKSATFKVIGPGNIPIDLFRAATESAGQVIDQGIETLQLLLF
jgi:hypothetical protein